MKTIEITTVASRIVAISIHWLNHCRLIVNSQVP